MKTSPLGFGYRISCLLLGAIVIAVGVIRAQKTQPPALDEVLRRLEANLNRYDANVPSLFCDEHVVSRVVPGPTQQNTITDSMFRLKRVRESGKEMSLVESREIKTINGHPATSQEIEGPTVLSGAFEGGLAVVSLGQSACMNYKFERPRKDDPKAAFIVRFSTMLTPQNSSGCLLQEEGKGRVFIDPATMEMTRLELTTPHHVIRPGSDYEPPIKGNRVLSIDYAPVVLEGRTFWMPSTITSTVTSGGGTFHAIVWSYKASYRNFHKLKVPRA